MSDKTAVQRVCRRLHEALKHSLLLGIGVRPICCPKGVGMRTTTVADECGNIYANLHLVPIAVGVSFSRVRYQLLVQQRTRFYDLCAAATLRTSVVHQWPAGFFASHAQLPALTSAAIAAGTELALETASSWISPTLYPKQ